MNRCHSCKRESLKLLKIFFLIFYLNNFAVGSDSIEQSNFDGKAVVIDINNYSFIDSSQGNYLKDSLEKLSQSDPVAIVLNISCSGGLASEVRWFIDDFTKLKPKTISFINGPAKGAGALAAISSRIIYFNENVQIGGEPKELEWRGKFDLLPQRFSDLSYYDIIEDVSKIFGKDAFRVQLARGICDQDKEVNVNDVRFSRAGEHLTIKRLSLIHI